MLGTRSVSTVNGSEVAEGSGKDARRCNFLPGINRSKKREVQLRPGRAKSRAIRR